MSTLELYTETVDLICFYEKIGVDCTELYELKSILARKYLTETVIKRIVWIVLFIIGVVIGILLAEKFMTFFKQVVYYLNCRMLHYTYL